MPDRLAIARQQHGYRDKSNGQETQDSVSPSQAQGFCHAWPGKWQYGAKQAAERRDTANGRSSVLRETVDNVRLQCAKDAHEAETKGGKGNNGDDPVDVVLC